MGGENSRDGNGGASAFPPNERRNIDALYSKICGKLDQLTPQGLQVHLQDVMSKSMCGSLFHAMAHFSVPLPHTKPVPSINRPGFHVALTYLLKGSPDEKVKMIRFIASPHPAKTVNSPELQTFIEGIVGVYVKLVNEDSQEKLHAAHIYTDSVELKRQAALLAEYITTELFHPNPRKRPASFQMPEAHFVYSDDDLRRWISQSSLLTHITSYVFERAFPVLENNITESLIPEFSGKKSKTEYVDLLTLPAVCLLQDSTIRDRSDTWTLLFDSKVHGESYSNMIGKLKKHKNTLMIIRDTHGHMFGGYITAVWSNHPAFRGTGESFLFNLSPNMAVYKPSGINENYFYLNSGQETLPNGMGMGGQFEYFGLWLEQEYGHGHSMAKPTSTTYNSFQLSAEPRFRFTEMEVWRLTGKADREEAEEEEAEGGQAGPSILDKDPEAQAMLEIMGKTRHSEGLREGDPTVTSPGEHEVPHS